MCAVYEWTAALAHNAFLLDVLDIIYAYLPRKQNFKSRQIQTDFGCNGGGDTKLASLWAAVPRYTEADFKLIMSRNLVIGKA